MKTICIKDKQVEPETVLTLCKRHVERRSAEWTYYASQAECKTCIKRYKELGLKRR